MKEHSPRLIVTFYTTAAAMAMEKCCAAHSIPGKLSSVPRSITADCGIAWSASLSERAALEKLVEEYSLEVSGFYEV